MRPLALALFASGFSACTPHAPVDALDAPITLTAVDTVEVEWRTIGLVGLVPKERFVWTCGTFDRTPAERADMYSIDAVIRSKGGVACY